MRMEHSSSAGLRPSANYELEAEVGGFANTRQKISLMESGHIVVKVELGRIREAVVVEADAPSKPASDGPPQRIRVGGKVQTARLIRHVLPVYPEDAREEGVDGTVLLEAIISEEGQPVSLTAVNNLVDERLVRAAIEAVSQWRYRPTLAERETGGSSDHPDNRIPVAAVVSEPRPLRSIRAAGIQPAAASLFTSVHTSSGPRRERDRERITRVLWRKPIQLALPPHLRQLLQRRLDPLPGSPQTPPINPRPSPAASARSRS